MKNELSYSAGGCTLSSTPLISLCLDGGIGAHTQIPVVSERSFCVSHKLEYQDEEGDMEENAFCCCYAFYQSL